MTNVKKEIKGKQEILDMCLSMFMNSGLRIAEIRNQLTSSSMIETKKSLGHVSINMTSKYIKN